MTVWHQVRSSTQLKFLEIRGGSTGDTVVIAALEWALDPNQDLELDDRLDVVNLSLGGDYGKPHIMYSIAMANFVKSGSVIVASAGNSNNVDNIVGAPSTAIEAISVAASVDYMEHNWKFSAVEIESKKSGVQIAQLVQGPISTPVEKFPGLVGSLIPAGLGDKSLDADLAAKVKGNVALMDRGGKISFVDKLKVAQEAGAIGVVVVNNEPGDPTVMGGEVKEPFPFPAVMITKSLGDLIKSEIASGERVTVLFDSDKEIEKRELIDTITSFSSKGPRSQDSLIKPEITAPGAQIISAAAGKGAESARMNGTSMSGPHITGAMALLKQYHPDLTQQELKSLIMTSASVMSDKEGVRYPISRQGAGRVQLFKAATSSIVVSQPALSLGEVMVDRGKVIQKEVQIKSLVSVPLNLTFDGDTVDGLELLPVAAVTLPAQGEVTVRLRFKISIESESKSKSPYIELDGFVKIKSGNAKIAHMPVLAVVNQISRVQGKQLLTFASSKDDAAGALVELTLTNTARNSGEALIFNQLGQEDDRKNRWKREDEQLSRSCDLQSAGYRVINKQGENYLQVGIKLYNPVTQWEHCEVSVQIDGTLDGVADQELVGLNLKNIAGLGLQIYKSVLLDASKVRELRAEYDSALESGKPVGLSFVSAIEGNWEYRAYPHSSVAMMEAPLSKLSRTKSGELAIKLAVLSGEGVNVEEDDFLSGHLNSWVKIQVDPRSQAYSEIPESVVLGAKSTQQASMNRGEGEGSLLLLYPQNRSVRSGTVKDTQSEIITERYMF
ncbi:S8 family serine peptidase [Bdellovibrionales bacterium]|nr:S8 family serine peptidase [Bdellovibrionales bacterium]